MEDFLKAARAERYPMYPDEPVMSPDSAVSSMLLNQKKDKTCLVCGDKALGYNFNAISCESCKAFFRRNAHKTIRGRCEGKCDVNIESRSFCKRCRLQKCFTVGMRKDMILDDDQKMLRKQKILINRLKRHGTLPPEDTYAVSESDLEQTYGERFVSQSEESLRKQYPNLSDEDIQVLRNIKKEKGTESSSATKCENQKKTQKYKPWNEVKDHLEDMIKDMPEQEQSLLLEMNTAHEVSSFLSSTMTRLKNLPSNPTEVFNIADGFVRRIIKVAKQLPCFRSIEKDDQIALLKGSVVEIMMLRSAVNFDVKTETWNLSTVSCIKKEGEEGASTGIPGGLNIEALRKAAMGGADFNTLRKMAMGGADPGSMNNEAVARQQPADICSRMPADSAMPMANLDHLRNMATSSGLNVDALRKAAMNGASYDHLSQMARGHTGGVGGMSTPVDLSHDASARVTSPDSHLPLGRTTLPDEKPPEQGSSISAEILKLGNSETKTMFLTYSKFIRSLMSTIFGDLIILKFLIMLSLFSPDRPGVENRRVIETVQERYASALQKYIDTRFPEEKNMFARCVMKLTDLRNVNEVHTKMLLKMQVNDIEPLLVEIFDLPQ